MPSNQESTNFTAVLERIAVALEALVERPVLAPAASMSMLTSRSGSTINPEYTTPGTPKRFTFRPAGGQIAPEFRMSGGGIDYTKVQQWCEERAAAGEPIEIAGLIITDTKAA